MDDESTFKSQRRNLILISFAIFLYRHGEGAVSDHFHLAILPLTLHKPEVVLHAAIFAYFYFIYRFWVCGGNLFIHEYRKLKDRMYNAIPQWKDVFIKHVENIYDPSKEGLSANTYYDIEVHSTDWGKINYIVNMKQANVSSTVYKDGGYIDFKLSTNIFLAFKSFWWAIRNDSMISDYCVPYVLAIYALYLMMKPELIKYLYILHILTK